MSSETDSTRKHRSEFTDVELSELSTDDFITLGHKGWLEVHPEDSVQVTTLRGEGWLEVHPEDQEQVKLEAEGTVFYEGGLFKELDPEEEADFRQHARETYEIGMPINTLFHPVWKDEARKMNKEVADAASSS